MSPFDDDVDRRMFLKYGAAFSTRRHERPDLVRMLHAVDLTRKDMTGKHKVSAAILRRPPMVTGTTRRSLCWR